MSKRQLITSRIKEWLRNCASMHFLIINYCSHHFVCGSTDHCPAPRRCCTSCQRCTWVDSVSRRCSKSCLGFCGERWAPGSGADQHNRQSCTVCLKTWLGETHKAVVTLILFMHLDTTIWTWWRPCGTYWFKAFRVGARKDLKCTFQQLCLEFLLLSF